MIFPGGGDALPAGNGNGLGGVQARLEGRLDALPGRLGNIANAQKVGAPGDDQRRNGGDG